MRREKKRKRKSWASKRRNPVLSGPKIILSKTPSLYRTPTLPVYSICHLSKQVSGPKHPFPLRHFPPAFSLLSQVLKTIPSLPRFDLALFISLGEKAANRLDSCPQAPVKILLPLYFRSVHPLKRAPVPQRGVLWFGLVLHSPPFQHGSH